MKKSSRLIVTIAMAFFITWGGVVFLGLQSVNVYAGESTQMSQEQNALYKHSQVMSAAPTPIYRMEQPSKNIKNEKNSLIIQMLLKILKWLQQK